MKSVQTRPSSLHKPGLTLLELLLVIAAIAVAIGVLLPNMCSRPRPHVRQIKDSSQIRAIHQGFVLFAQDNHPADSPPSTKSPADEPKSLDAPEPQAACTFIRIQGIEVPLLVEPKAVP